MAVELIIAQEALQDIIFGKTLSVCCVLRVYREEGGIYSIFHTSQNPL